MPVTQNSQMRSSVYAHEQYIDSACGCRTLYSQIQGEDTLIFRTDITVSCFSNPGEYL
jgi:hypothetical protein